jgi:hypothetical protein
VCFQFFCDKIKMYVVPERATMSFCERPCAAKRDVRLASPDVGGGMLLLAPLKLAVVESRRPTFTFQFGPPSYHGRARTYDDQ